MAGSARLAAGSLLTLNDQEQAYREAMGAEAAERQRLAAARAAGRCTCSPSKVRKRWDGADRPSVRTVHAETCPRHLPWMQGS